MHPPLTLHKHPMCAEVRELLAEGLCTPEISWNVVLGRPVAIRKNYYIIEEFQKCHIDHPIGKFFGKCTDLKIKLDRCFREEKALKRKANFEESKKLKERLQAFRKETADKGPEEKNFV